MSEQPETDDYYQKLEQFAQEQQDKVDALIEQSNQMMEQLQPFNLADKVDEKVEKLLQNVNDELEKAMTQVNDQMKQLNQKINSSNE